MFVEEIQCDLHQTARDRGYADQNKIAEANNAKVQAQENLVKLQEKERAWLDKHLLMRASPADNLSWAKPVYSFKPSSSLTVPYSDAKMKKLQKELNEVLGW